MSNDVFPWRPIVLASDVIINGHAIGMTIRGYASEAWHWVVQHDDGFNCQSAEVGVAASLLEAKEQAAAAAERALIR